LHCLSTGASAYTLAARLQGGLPCIQNSTTTRTLSTSSSTSRRVAVRTKMCFSGWFVLRRHYFCGGHIYVRRFNIRGSHGGDNPRRTDDSGETSDAEPVVLHQGSSMREPPCAHRASQTSPAFIFSSENGRPARVGTTKRACGRSGFGETRRSPRRKPDLRFPTRLATTTG
jgi:hypothetical protein